MPQKEREAVPSLTELRQDGYQVIGTRIGDSEQMIMFATRNQNVDLLNMGDIAKNVSQMRAFEADRNGRAVRELSQDEMRAALGVPTSFAQEARQQEIVQSYRDNIENARATQGDVAAIQLAFNQWQYQSNNTIAGQMAGVFKDIFSFEIGDLRGTTPAEITALLEERGMEVRVAARAPEVREEPRVAEVPLTSQQQTTLANYRDAVQSALNDGDTQLAYLRGITQWKYENNSNVAGAKAAAFEEITGITLDEARSRLPPQTQI